MKNLLFTMQWIRRNKHTAAFLFTALAGVLFFFFPTFADIFYRRCVFQLFRMGWDFTMGYIPFPKIFLWCTALPIILCWMVLRHRKQWILLWKHLLHLLSALVLFFFWSWGFNYFCLPFIKINDNAWMENSDYYSLGLFTAEQCAQWRSVLSDDAIKNNPVSEHEIRDAVAHFLHASDWPTLGRVRCFGNYPLIPMRKAGVAGIYIPLAGEGYTSGTFLSVSKLFIMAHEMAHGYGITGEGEADFVAYMSLLHHQGNSAVYFHYAAELELLRSVRAHLRIADSSLWQSLVEATDNRVNADINQIRDNHLHYPEYFPGAGQQVNHAYLKTMGIKEGIKNYDRFVEMVWQFKPRSE